MAGVTKMEMRRRTSQSLKINPWNHYQPQVRIKGVGESPPPLNLSVSGTLGDARPIPEGHYRFSVQVGAKTHEATFWINTGAATVVTVHPENAGK